MPLASRSEYFRTNLLASTTLSRSFFERALPWDFGTLRRIKHVAATYAGFPYPTVQHLQAFSASWRVTPRHALPALFHAGDALELQSTEAFPLR
jgi:hypothetical protein